MDYSLPVRRAVLPAMKENDALTALIPAASIFGATVPLKRTLPFTRYGAPIATPFRLSGLNSSSIGVTIHAFTGPAADGTNTAEDLCWRMAAAIKDALDERALLLEGDMTATVTWVGSNCIVDRDETSAWHAIVNFQVDVAG